MGEEGKSLGTLQASHVSLPHTITVLPLKKKKKKKKLIKVSET